jgi:hypothetical protein
MLYYNYKPYDRYYKLVYKSRGRQDHRTLGKDSGKVRAAQSQETATAETESEVDPREAAAGRVQ